MSANKVSVIVPLYNAEKYIEETMKSILAQTYDNLEVVVVNDASTDKSGEIVRMISDKRIVYVDNKTNMGISKTRNKAIELSTGDYIALWDDDDLCPPNRIAVEIETITREDADITVGHYYEIDEAGEKCSKEISSLLNPLYLKAREILSNSIGNGTGLINKRFIVEHDIRYRDNMLGAEDYRFWVECMVAGAKFSVVDEVMMFHRKHGANACQLAELNNAQERKEVIREIQSYALAGLGFSLGSDDMKTIHEFFSEQLPEPKNDTELDLIYKALKEIANQAQKLGLDNADEIRTMCRKRYAEKVGKAFYLWEGATT